MKLFYKTILMSATLLMANINLSAAKLKTIRLQIIETSDTHGGFFPWDFTNNHPTKTSMAHVSSYINKVRKENPDAVILLENGDILQGQPINYYFNYIATDKQNISSQYVNLLKYDAQNFGNHDLETGHPVYDKWKSELLCPLLGANIISKDTGKPYAKPYTIIERKGVKVAVIGLVTPAVPNWLAEDLWEGMEFKEMISSAREWIDIVQRTEQPDVVIGLFHSGKANGIATPDYTENMSMRIAQEVPGFDAIMFGHDHDAICEMTTSSDGRQVLIINPGNNVRYVAQATVTITKKGKKMLTKSVEGQLVSLANEQADENYLQHFSKEIDNIKLWTSQRIGTIEHSIDVTDCFFGSSAFTDLIHNLQLQLTGADISLSAPQTYKGLLDKGDVTVADMFKLYKFENTLYTMRLTGKEIHQLLEMSYNQWVSTMSSPDDHIMLIKQEKRNNRRQYSFQNPAFNFDSAAGIDYEVDVTKPEGQRVTILQMSDGEPFNADQLYTVAVNSYRGNGGGELLTKGAGIPKEELKNRIISRTEKDLRFYLMQEIERLQTISPKANNNWRFVPDEWAIPAIKRDRQLLFGN